MNPSNMHVASNLQTEACTTNIPMFIHQFQLTFRPSIHGNLVITCQGRMKGFNLIRFILKHEDIRSV